MDPGRWSQQQQQQHVGSTRVLQSGSLLLLPHNNLDFSASTCHYFSTKLAKAPSLALCRPATGKSGSPAAFSVIGLGRGSLADLGLELRTVAA